VLSFNIIYIKSVQDSESARLFSMGCHTNDIYYAEKALHCCPRGTFSFRIDLHYKSPLYH